MYILTTLSLLIISIIAYLNFVYSHWKRKKFPYIQPTIPLGNLGPVARRQASLGINIYQLYQQTSEPVIGIYLLFRPALLIRDAKVIRNILSTDFNSFHDRGIYCNPKHDPLSENMFAMSGQRWKMLRAKLTPSFSSGKLKTMLPTIMTVGERIQDYMKHFANNNEIVEMKDLMSRFTLDIIGSVAFGLDVDTVNNPKHEFRTIEKKINTPDLVNVLKGVAVFLCPKILEFFNLSSMPEEVKDFMIGIVRKTIEHREKYDISRKDFIQYLIELRNRIPAADVDKVGMGDKEQDNTMDKKDVSTDSLLTPSHLKALSIETCAAQIFLFYVAGFDTSSSTIAYCIYELARNPEIMKKLQLDIDNTLRKYDGVLSYECILDMAYLDLCIMEIIRKYPALPILNRECTKNYQIPNSNLTVEKGTAIIISLIGISRDPNYFPEPEKYIPERFLPNVQNYDPTAYIPFGDGPRSCIGVRLGKIVSKIGLIKLLEKYDFECVDDREIEFDNFAVILIPKHGLNVRIRNRKDI